MTGTERQKQRAADFNEGLRLLGQGEKGKNRKMQSEVSSNAGGRSTPGSNEFDDNSPLEFDD